MNNIAEILTGCDGKGIILYSPLYGNVELLGIRTGALYPIICRVFKNDDICQFSSDGRADFADSECLLYPSKDQRDWNKFGVTDQKQKTALYPFDKVLVRNNDDDEWVCDIFSHIDELAFYYCVGTRWEQCIPYEGNEHLLGTTNKQQ